MRLNRLYRRCPDPLPMPDMLAIVEALAAHEWERLRAEQLTRRNVVTATIRRLHETGYWRTDDGLRLTAERLAFLAWGVHEAGFCADDWPRWRGATP